MSLLSATAAAASRAKSRGRTTRRRQLANIVQLLAIAFYCCSQFKLLPLVQAQQQQQQQQPSNSGVGQQQQQQQLKYQQLQYQMQQQYEYQQQQHYQQQFQQQQQQHQQQQQQQQLVLPTAQAQALSEQPIDLLATNQPTQQLLQTGVSLIVDDGQPTPEATLPRRRPGGAKRKRRPQLPLATMGANEEESPNGGSLYWRGHVEDDQLSRRKQQPATLERERMRQRQTEATPSGGAGGGGSKAYRRPYGQAKKQDQEQQQLQQPASTVANKTPVDLKNILKNSGGLSLSEILQQKNLSLDDLLKGKQNALLALQTTAVAPAVNAATSSQEPRTTLAGHSNNSNNNNKQSVRRIPAAFLAQAKHDEQEQQQQQQQQQQLQQQQLLSSEDSREELFRPKPNKLPALQRLKLFGSSSRDGNAPSRRSSTAPTTVASTTTTTAATTTRLPIYKKRQQMRSTLKPPSLFKATSTSATTTTTAAAATTATVAEEDEDGDGEDEEEEQLLETTAPATQTTGSATVAVSEPEPAKLDVSEEQQYSSELPPAATRYRTRNISSSSNSNNNSNEQSKHLSDNFIGNSYDKNSVESIEDVELELADNAVLVSTAATHNSSSSSEEQPIYNDGNDELENFFDEVESNTHHIRVPAPNPTATSTPAAVAATTTAPTTAATATISKRGKQQKTQRPQQQSALPQTPHLVDDVDDRTDLLELIEDRRSGNRLFKVLEQRNMTLEELIEHRKRGSSQLHLSTILSNGDEHSRFYPGQKVVLQDNMDIVTAFENFPHFNLIDLKSVKPDEIKTDSQGSSYFTSIIDIEPSDSDSDRDSDNDDNNRNQGLSMAATLASQQQRAEKSLGFFPSWKTLALASLATATAGRSAASVANSMDDKRNAYYLPPPRLLLDGNNGNTGSSQELYQDQDQDNNSMDIDLSVNAYGNNGNATKLTAAATLNNEDNSDVIDTIENEVARAHDLLDLELSGHGFRRSPSAAAATSMSQQHLASGNSGSSSSSSSSSLYASMPAGIRSAIVASAAIVLTSLSTFLVIFVVCRWKQHRRRKTSYLKTYNAMKSKLPQLAQTANASRRNSLRQHMEELVIGSSSSCSNSSNGNHNNNNNSNGCHKPAVSIATVSCNTPVHHHHHHQLQRQSSLLLFNREGSKCSSTAAAATSSAAAATTSTTTATATSTSGGSRRGGGGVNSLALTLCSTHQKLNTMDPNSPEVQEYLFDTLRKSFDN